MQPRPCDGISDSPNGRRHFGRSRQGRRAFKGLMAIIARSRQPGNKSLFASFSSEKEDSFSQL
jgi:hypothetical protein